MWFFWAAGPVWSKFSLCAAQRGKEEQEDKDGYMAKISTIDEAKLHRKVTFLGGVMSIKVPESSGRFDNGIIKLVEQRHINNEEGNRKVKGQHLATQKAAALSPKC